MARNRLKNGIMMGNHLVVWLVACIILSCNQAVENPVYESNWESLSAHQAAPTWFQDAK